MSEDYSNPRCDECGLLKKANRGASMTSWLSVCMCDSKSDTKEPEETPAIEICKNCGKRINTGRDGSFTQWIFRTDVCSCSIADARQIVQTAATESDLDSSALDKQDEIEDEEIDIGISAFPTDRYKPVKELGEGSSGAVYLCRDKLLGIDVAIKCMKDAGDEEIISFQKEAKLVSKLAHPNIVNVIDFGVSGQSAPYMVMEYYDGISLKAFIQSNGAISIEDSSSLFSGVCEGLAYIHKKSVFHRDVTSMNILVKRNPEGELVGRLVDFGVALELERQSKTSEFQGKLVVGTPSYMAPDQVNGREYDARSEIYSLGCVMYEALTGQLPFEGDSSFEVISSHTSSIPPSMEDLRPELQEHDKLVNLIEKCLEKEQERRFQSVAELNRQLQSASSDYSDLPAENFLQEEELVEPGSKTEDLSDGKYENNFVREQKNHRLSITISLLTLVAVLAVGAVPLLNILDVGSNSSKEGELNSSSNSENTSKANGEELMNKLSFPEVREESITAADPMEAEPHLFKNWHNEPIYKFNLTSPGFGDAVTYVAGHKARLEWNQLMTLHFLPPDYERFYIRYSFDKGVSDDQTAEKFMKEKFNRRVDLDVSNVKFLGEEPLQGYLCGHYKCLLDGVKMEFWATKEWMKNDKLERMCAKVVGVPPGYGIPMKAYKTFTRKQMKVLDKKSSTYQELKKQKGRGSKTITWLVVTNVEKLENQANNRKLFLSALRYIDQKSKE